MGLLLVSYSCTFWKLFLVERKLAVNRDNWVFDFKVMLQLLSQFNYIEQEMYICAPYLFD